MTPRAQMSQAGLTSSPATCSGAMYSSVPTNTPALVPDTVDVLQRPVGINGLGEAEVEHLRHAAADVSLQKNVLRLQIAVDQALSVGRADRGAHATQDVQNICRGQRPVAREPLADGRPLQQFHHQEWPAIAIDAEVVHPHHVRMGKTCGGAGFVAKARIKIERTGDVLPNQLHGDAPFEEFVHRGVDRSHATAAQTALETVPIVEQTRAARRSEGLAVVGAHVGPGIKAAPATVALGQRAPAGPPSARASPRLPAQW